MAYTVEFILGSGLVCNRQYIWISDFVPIRCIEHTSEPGNNKKQKKTNEK